MRAYPPTPGTPSDCGQVTDEDEYSDEELEQGYQIVVVSTRQILPATLDYRTSAETVRAQVKALGVLEDRCDFDLVFGLDRLEDPNQTLKHLFKDVHNQDQRFIKVEKRDPQVESGCRRW